MEAASRLPEAEQAGFARRVCATDAALLAEVLSLLPHFQLAQGAKVSSPLGTTWRADGGTSFITRLTAGESISLEESDDRLPDYIDQYRILDVLGRGGMGIVYRGQHVISKRPVAIKVLQKRLASQEGRLRFAYEAEILRQLLHPGIARMIYANMANSAFRSCNYYFVMEHVEGETLTAYSRTRGLGLRDKLELLVKICDVVEYAHQRGIIHLDLKPSNILVTTESDRLAGGPHSGRREDRRGSRHAGGIPVPRPKILDFGIAQIVATGSCMLGSQRAGFAGTPDYASPEQLAGRIAELTARSDVYALGLIAHELLVGRLPDMCGGRMRLSLGGISTEDDGLGVRSDDRLFRYVLGSVLARALHANEQKRYRSAGELGCELAGTLQGLSPQSRWRRLRGRISKWLTNSSPSRALDQGDTTSTSAPNPLARPLWAVVRTRVHASVRSNADSR